MSSKTSSSSGNVLFFVLCFKNISFVQTDMLQHMSRRDTGKTGLLITSDTNQFVKSQKRLEA